VEDSRTTDADSLRVLTDAIADPNAVNRARAARALGRLERGAFIPLLRPLIADHDRRVRMEAINGIAQIAKSKSRPLDQPAFDEILGALITALGAETDPEVVGVIARSLGRISRDEESVARTRQALASLRLNGGEIPMLSVERVDEADPRALFGIMHALYSMARTIRPSAGQAAARPTAFDVHMLRYGIGGRPGAPNSNRSLAVEIRRLTLLALNAANTSADSLAVIAIQDRDGQMRRLAVLAVTDVSDTALRRQVLAKALSDSAFIVRFEAVRSWRRFFTADCAPLITATRDHNPHVMLAAIDALGSCSSVNQSLSILEPLAASAPPDPARRHGRASWHAHAHAIVALARIDAPRATRAVQSDVSHPVWQVRMYAARAATIVRDTATLARLAFDSVGGVREAALDGLAATSGHDADPIFVRALSSDDHHVVLAAARALKGAPARDSILPQLLVALERLARVGKDNSRDPRMEVLQRIGEFGDASIVSRIEPYVRDFDVAVAERAAAILTQWTGRSAAANPKRLQQVSPDLARIASASDVRMRFTMAPGSGGGSFVVRLRTSAAPATAQRLIALATRGYYNGLTFHRVEPTFVIQGGSPRATEYVGDGPFMRDEVDLASHARGTMGISTRGRDTGDAQIFVNLTDNFRLDHDYTVVGELIEGMAVVDGILEGDVIARVIVSGLGRR
jgi:cyclophilin family peptidyl-prolyl cis-trans isomerase/HEAT repeat protein